MAQRAIWTQSASNDLEQISEFIGKDSPYYASSFISKILEITRSLKALPCRGRITPEFGDSKIREILIGRYRLIYHVDENAIAILGLIHGARNLTDIWKNRRL